MHCELSKLCFLADMLPITPKIHYLTELFFHNKTDTSIHVDLIHHCSFMAKIDLKTSKLKPTNWTYNLMGGNFSYRIKQRCILCADWCFGYLYTCSSVTCGVKVTGGIYIWFLCASWFGFAMKHRTPVFLKCIWSTTASFWSDESH